MAKMLLVDTASVTLSQLCTGTVVRTSLPEEEERDPKVTASQRVSRSSA